MDAPVTANVRDTCEGKRDQCGHQEHHQRHRSVRARSWSLGSYSTITTVDETSDFSKQEQSICSTPSIFWGGGAPLEVNVPSIALVTTRTSSTSHQHVRGMANQSKYRTYSTPIDLDLMEDYYEYKKPQKKTDTGEAKSSFVSGEEFCLPSMRNTNWCNSSGGPELRTHLPQRLRRFEI
jgi:hypothetical protein